MMRTRLSLLQLPLPLLLLVVLMVVLPMVVQQQQQQSAGVSVSVPSSGSSPVMLFAWAEEVAPTTNATTTTTTTTGESAAAAPAQQTAAETALTTAAESAAPAETSAPAAPTETSAPAQQTAAETSAPAAPAETSAAPVQPQIAAETPAGTSSPAQPSVQPSAPKALRVLLIGGSIRGAEPYLTNLFAATSAGDATADFSTAHVKAAPPLTAAALGCSDMANDNTAPSFDDVPLDAENPLDCTSGAHDAAIVPLLGLLRTGNWTHVVLQDVNEHVFHEWHSKKGVPYMIALVQHQLAPDAHVLLVVSPLPANIVQIPDSDYDTTHGVTHRSEDGEYYNIYEQNVVSYFSGVLAAVKELSSSDRYASVGLMPLAKAVGWSDHTPKVELSVILGDSAPESPFDPPLTPAGNYLAACMLFSTITGKSVVGSPVPGGSTSNGNGGGAGSRRRLLRMLAASNAQRTSHVFTPLDASATPDLTSTLSHETVLAMQRLSDDAINAFLRDQSAQAPALPAIRWTTEWVPAAESSPATGGSSKGEEGEEGGEGQTGGGGGDEGQTGEGQSGGGDDEILNGVDAGASTGSSNAEAPTGEAGGADGSSNTTEAASDASGSPFSNALLDAPTLPLVGIAALILASLCVLNALWAKCKHDREQAWLRKRRGYDDAELASFNIRKDKTKLYDDGL